MSKASIVVTVVVSGMLTLGFMAPPQEKAAKKETSVAVADTTAKAGCCCMNASKACAGHAKKDAGCSQKKVQK